MKDLVWYASYGSNLLKNRFLKYILGGQVPGSSFIQIGCTDKTLPLEDAQIIIPHELYFAGESVGWENKAVSYIKEVKSSHKTLGRKYLVTKRQFIEIVAQENGLKNYNIEINFEEANSKGHSVLSLKNYNKIIFIGNSDNYPIYTFTSKRVESEIQYNTPGKKYLTTIIEGVRETYDITNNELLSYISNMSGIKETISKEELMILIEK